MEASPVRAEGNLVQREAKQGQELSDWLELVASLAACDGLSLGFDSFISRHFRVTVSVCLLRLLRPWSEVSLMASLFN